MSGRVYNARDTVAAVEYNTVHTETYHDTIFDCLYVNVKYIQFST